ncbi:zinc ribbon domain-containing protein [Sporomusa sphaeroides]|uniref:zinc ribbon domain-containing protein n=1 Tax=Sporomusa sphaeroides TaxID=47679 RepID=UPI002CBAA6DD|nr:zinc ribbon domain-containing protein [Sporomusa sphaeroides]HML35168.1 zinc ribbon domain-containing protein [Sporomusa sphaeroides]
MGFEDLFKVFGGHHGGHHGDRHHGGHDSHHGHGGHNYGYREPCGQNPPVHNAPSAPAVGQEPCPKCTRPVQAGFKFCPACGASLEPAACKGCGAKLPPAAAFCPGCGAKAQG